MRYVLNTNRGLDRSHRARATHAHGALSLNVKSESATHCRLTTQPDLTLLEFHELAAYEQAKARRALACS